MILPLQTTAITPITRQGAIEKFPEKAQLMLDRARGTDSPPNLIEMMEPADHKLTIIIMKVKINIIPGTRAAPILGEIPEEAVAKLESMKVPKAIKVPMMPDPSLNTSKDSPMWIVIFPPEVLVQGPGEATTGLQMKMAKVPCSTAEE
jgi:hypothetical protein